jgi:endonuclease G
MRALDAALAKQHDAAAKRVRAGTQRRQGKIRVLGEPGGIARADDPERVATRIDRLSHYHPDIRPISPSGIVEQDEVAMRAATAVLERVINTDDFLGVGYLEAGVLAARAVGRVNIRESSGRLAGYGTGSLVSPKLLLTNNHVLPDADAAASSGIEFNYEDGVNGQPLQPVLLAFDPKSFFLTDEERDFTLVAVQATSQELVRFGFNRLFEAEGKAIVGDFVTIIQHPGGEKKQVALRENRVVDVLELFLHYETDTEPGSSGSPIFNDQWEVVALHHASVPAPEHGELGGIVNEGIRVSQLVAFVRNQHLSAAQQAFADQLFAASVATAATSTTVKPISSGPLERPAGGREHPVRVTVPLEITVRAGDVRTSGPVAAVSEAISIDPDYADRAGYDPAFLEVALVPLPTLPDDLVPLAAINSMATSEPSYVLPYHHFSIVLNKERRLAFFTAVNIDGSSSFRLPRETDRWSFDPRVLEEEQTGEEIYADNPLDRGHLVRRLDPTWGPTSAAAKICNDDTFHFTNCTPQHREFNEYQTLWAGLEDYILDNADNLNFKVSVFSGPLLAADDDAYRGVNLPRQFWKVVVMVKGSGDLSATAYLLSQEGLIAGLEVMPEEFSYGAYRTYQVAVSRIEELTRLSFGSLVEADPLAHMETAVAHVAHREVRRPDELVL